MTRSGDAFSRVQEHNSDIRLRLRSMEMKILLAISDEASARAISDFIAEKLIPSGSTEITILNVAEPLPLDSFISNVYGYPVPHELMEPVLKKGQDLAETTIERLKSALPADTSYTKEVVMGHPVKVILDRCQMLRPNVIVLGAHGEQQFLMQSISREVARLVPCSVVVLKMTETPVTADNHPDAATERRHYARVS
jgi:nucleotide-binding universal stress UspA family protein